MDSEEDSKSARMAEYEQDEDFNEEDHFQQDYNSSQRREIETTEEIILRHIDNDKLIQSYKSGKEEITDLDFDVRGNVYICIFLAGVSDNRTNVFKTTLQNNKMEFEEFIKIKDDQKFFDLLISEPNLILKAIEYTIETKMVSILEHIIDEASSNYLDMHIKDDIIKKLICLSDDSTNKLILRRLCGRYITLLQTSERFEHSLDEDKEISHIAEDSEDISIMNKDPVETKNPRDLMPYSTETKIKPSKGDHEDYSKDDEDIKHNYRPNRGMTSKMGKINSGGPKVGAAKAVRENFYTKYLERSDVIEIAIDLLDQEDVIKLIYVLYDDFGEPTPDNYKLFKLLIQTEHMELFELCIQRCLDPKKMSFDTFEDIKAQVDQERSTFMKRINRSKNLEEDEKYLIKSKGSRYDVQEIVSDCFANAIVMNKMHIAFYLYREYKKAVLGNVQMSIDSILYAFKVDYQVKNKIINVEERLFVLEKFIPYIDYQKSFELIETYRNLICETPELNFMTYCKNPLKIIVTMISQIRQLKIAYPLLKYQVDHLNDILENIGSIVIRNSKSVDDVQDLLLDKLYNDIEIIDMIAHLNCIPILQNPIVDVIISNMYYGPYQRGSFLKDSKCFQIIQDELSFFPGDDVTASSKMTIFSYKEGNAATMRSSNVYEIEDGGDPFEISDEQIKENAGNDSKEIGHMFQFVVWKKSLDVKYIFNAVIAFTLAVVMQVFSALLIEQIRDADSIDDKITETSENSSLSTVEKNKLLDQYTDELEDSTALYYEYITFLLIIHVLTIAYLFQNFQEIIYSRLRGVYTKVITLSIILNFLTSALVIYWLYKYLYQYTVDLDGVDSRRKVKTIIDRIKDDDYFDLELAIAFLTSIQYTRMIFALQMSRIFGPMVKILGNMLIDLSLFIFMYLLVFLIFTCASQLMFNQIEGYDSFINCTLTLFSAALGDFSFDVFAEESTFTRNIGYLFLISYLIVSTITLLNFLIAILSNTYDFLTGHKNALYLREVIYLRQQYGYEPRYSSIISAFVPLNIFAMIMDPIIICLKSSKINDMFLLFEYIVLGILSVIIFFAISALLLPISYVILILDKLKFCFTKPFLGKGDVLYRVLDLITIFFIGLLWLIILLFWSTGKFIVKLFASDIKLLEENREEKQAHTNALKDGSVDYTKFNLMYGDPEREINLEAQEKAKSQNKNKTQKNYSTGNVGNPIKGGMSLTTLKLLKITLLIMRDDYLKKTKKDKTTTIMVPMGCLIKEIYKHFFIQEHINQICLGVYYEKDQGFFETERYSRIVEGFKYYEAKDAKLATDKANYKNLARGIYLKPMIERKNDIRALYWRNKLKSFLMDSEEKWILDQYNQIKRFCNENAVEAVPTCYSIEDLKEAGGSAEGSSKSDNFSRKDNSKANTSFAKKPGSFESQSTNDSLKSSSAKAESEKNDQIPKEKCPTIDISSLLETFIEIEKNLEMRKILNSKRVNRQKLRYLGEKSVINEKDEYDGHIQDTHIPKSFLLKESSMISFKRNWESLAEALEEVNN
ncbi:unnamed protein product [Moneuplotes crassus]|uniref:Ion transport domain-containing protein n=1 Tax=Euplotes crassus TaxID=5936 RepID=A0AAD2D796_EUPCR|nr:unnamed protein product [Moneuplotes crassus]